MTPGALAREPLVDRGTGHAAALGELLLAGAPALHGGAETPSHDAKILFRLIAIRGPDRLRAENAALR